MLNRTTIFSYQLQCSTFKPPTLTLIYYPVFLCILPFVCTVAQKATIESLRALNSVGAVSGAVNGTDVTTSRGVSGQDSDCATDNENGKMQRNTG